MTDVAQSAPSEPPLLQNRERVVFVACVLRGTEAGFHSHVAPYALRSYLIRVPEVAARYEVEIVRWTPTGNFPYTRLDRIAERGLSSLLQRSPRVIAFSLYVWNIDVQAGLAAQIKAIHPEVLLVAGGPEVADRDSFSETFDAFDVLVSGDGELPLSRMLQRLASGDTDFSDIPNLSFRRGGTFRHNDSSREAPPADQIPPVYADYPEELYGQICHAHVRGCSRACKYCQWASQPMRRKAAAQAVDELELIVSKQRVSSLVLFDYDLLRYHTDEPQLFARIARVLCSRPDLTYRCFTGVETLARAPAPVKELLLRLRRLHVLLGVQSLNPTALAQVNRSWAVPGLALLEEIDPALRARTQVELVFPLPAETPASWYDGIRRLLELGYFKFHLFPLMIMPGTALRREAPELGIEFMPRPPHLCFQTPTFSRRDWLDALGFSYVVNRLSMTLGHTRLGNEPFQRVYASPSGFVSQLLERIRGGDELDAILADLLAPVAPVDLQAVRDFNLEELNLLDRALRSDPGHAPSRS
jgi:hypothetical protein